jgi:hypothetical protein
MLHVLFRQDWLPRRYLDIPDVSYTDSVTESHETRKYSFPKRAQS